MGNNNMNNPVHELTEIELDRVSGGSEWNMITLQSLIGQRQTIIQMTTGMLRAINGSTSSIIKNIK